ncbi:MAG: hypothetical protein NTY19_18265 [Planctomycetota bacterium]|nr:hypothetical protein [Planctomycetota bacterium]
MDNLSSKQRSGIDLAIGLALMAVLIFAAPGITKAGLVWEESWRIPSQDGRYLLVMVSPHAVDEDASRQTREAEVREIRKTYKQSGLYRNDGSSEPLWTIPYHIPDYKVYIAPDGEHLVIAMEYWGHTISNIPRGGVVFFYRKGEALASYRDHELIRCFALKWMANSLFNRGIDCKEASFNPQSLTYTVTTSQSEEVVFDVTTGTIVRRWSPWPFYLGMPLVGVPLVVFGLCRRRSLRSTTDARQLRSWHQFSLREMFVLVAVVCLILWLSSLNSMLAIVCSVIAFVGGGISWICSRSRRAWLIGAILSLYGGFIGLLSWARLSDLVFSPLSRQDPHMVLGTLVALGSMGVVGGGLLGGWLERRARQPCHEDFHKQSATSTSNGG